MVFDPLAVVSAFLTFFAQATFAYLVVWGLCSLARNPRTRTRIWGLFLLFAVVDWGWACFAGRANVAAQSVGRAMGPTVALAPGWSWAVPLSHAARLSAWPAWLSLAYLVILGVLLVQLAVKAWGLRVFLRSGEEPAPDLNRTFQKLCRDMGVVDCELSLVPGLRSPATARWWHPRVLLPAELIPELDPRQVRNILRHELVHIRRHDYLWDRMAALACRIVFFHPVMWLAHQRLRWERELACDEAVVRHSDEQRVQYAECLTTLARWWFVVEKNSRGAIGFASSASLLGTRVRALLHEPEQSSAWQRLSRAGLVVLVLAMTAASLPGMRLTLYWAAPVISSLPEQASTKLPAMRSLSKVLRTAETRTQHNSAMKADDSPDLQAPANTPPAAVSAIEKPAMPVFSGNLNSGPPADFSSAEGDRALASSSPGGSDQSGAGAAPRAKRGPTWSDTAAGAITTGVAIIRSRGGSASSAGGTGAPAGGSSGGSGGGGGGEGGGEGSDHFAASSDQY